jgi:hypothetical protein
MYTYHYSTYGAIILIHIGTTKYHYGYNCIQLFVSINVLIKLIILTYYYYNNSILWSKFYHRITLMLIWLSFEVYVIINRIIIIYSLKLINNLKKGDDQIYLLIIINKKKSWLLDGIDMTLKSNAKD